VNVGEAGIGGSTTLSASGVVVGVAGGVGVERGTAPGELWWLDMRDLAVPPAGVLELVVWGILILLPRSSAMPQTD
jgi:hypothetical protein